MIYYDVLTNHNKKYTMKPADWMKLAYQSEYGCAHALSNPEASEKALLEEYVKTPADILEPLSVEIGGSYSRLSLAAAKNKILPELIFEMMKKSRAEGTDEGYDRKLRLTAKSAALGVISADKNELEAWFEANRDAIPSHSPLFKGLFHPHYRVVDTRFAKIAEALILICEVMKTGSEVRVAIDGRCGVGKTTVAQTIAEILPGIAIKEGTYSLKDTDANVRILVDTDPLAQRERLIERDGEAKFNELMETRIPAEEPYFMGLTPDDVDVVVKI